MWEMALVFEKRLKYVRNDIDMWEMAKNCGKWLKYLTNCLINWEMANIFGKWLRHRGHGLSISGTALVCCK